MALPRISARSTTTAEPSTANVVRSLTRIGVPSGWRITAATGADNVPGRIVSDARTIDTPRSASAA